MSERVTFATGRDGAPVARKSGLGPDDRARLGHEAALLRAARHPGVVTLLEQDADHLVLAWAGGHTLATTPQPDLDRAVALTVTVATTLADLHQIGITHGAVDASHIVLNGSGRPILCSFSHAAQADSPLDLGHRDRADADVMALGEVLSQLLREVGPAGPRRLLRHRYRVVSRLAERAASDPPQRRLSARAFAAALADAAPSARPAPPAAVDASPVAPLLEGPDPTPTPVPAIEGPPHALAYLDRLRPVEESPPPSRRYSRKLLSVTAGLGLALLVGTTVVDTTDGGREPSALPPAPPTGSGGSTTVDPDRPVPTTGPDTPPRPAVGGCTAPASGEPGPGLEPAVGHHDTDGDGCPERVVIDANTILVGDRRWTLGDRDDVVTVADWDCDGTATPALLRPGSGQVFVFTAWAPEGGTVETTAVTVVASAAAIAPDRGPCPALVITRTDGTHLTLPPSTTPSETPS